MQLQEDKYVYEQRYPTSPPCDKCEQRGVRFLQGNWLCSACADDFLFALLLEQYRCH